MENQIDELLNQISSFKTNIENSNELMTLLRDLQQRTRVYIDNLDDSHKSLMERFEESNGNIAKSIGSIESKSNENHSTILKINNLLQNAHINKLLWILIGIFLSSFLNLILLITIFIIIFVGK
jgi:predicted  nucleic acid-binding Zn-ribbon protein